MDVESEASQGNVLVGGMGSSDLRWWHAMICLKGAVVIVSDRLKKIGSER